MVHIAIRMTLQCLALALAVSCGHGAWAGKQAAGGGTPSHGTRVPSRFDATPGALPKAVIPLKVTVHFDLDPYRDAFVGDARYRLEVRQPVAAITMHARDLAVTDARLEGVTSAPTVTFDKAKDTVTFTWPHAIAAGEHTLTLKFSGAVNERGEGLYRTSSTGQRDRKMLVTQMEPIGARQLLPNFDEPSFRTVWEVAVTADPRFTVVGNMPVVQALAQSDHRTRTQFAPTPSMASYLLALAVGEFEKISDHYDGIELNLYTQPGQREQSLRVMPWTKEILAYLQGYFGIRYALPKLDQIAVPGKGGAMENWGLITYSESLLQVDPATSSAEQEFWAFSTIAHEITHQWFGNLVTMAWWDDLWLNESFAQWMGFKTAQALRPQWQVEARRIGERDTAMESDVLALARPIHRQVALDAQAFDSFDAISYQKGHAVVHMIEQYAGEAAWRQGLRTYLQRHRMGNAAAGDLWRAISGASNKPIQAFAESWITKPGFPLIDVATRCERGQQVVALSQSRFLLRPDDAPQQRWHVATRVGQVGGPSQAVQINGDRTEVRLAGCEGAVLLDPGSNSYVRIRNGDASFGKLLRMFSTLSIEDQQRLLSDGWALARVGLGSTQQSLDLIAAIPLQAPAQVWRYAADTYQQMITLLRRSPHEPQLLAQVQRTLLPKFEAMGWDAKHGESPSELSLRADLVQLLAMTDHAQVIAEARRRFAQREQDGSGMRGDLATGILMAVGLHASKAQWDALAAMLSDPRYSALEWPLGRALGSARDPDVIHHALETSLTDQLPRSVSSRLPARIAELGGADRAVWTFVQANRSKLFDRSNRWGQRFIYPAALQGSRDLELAQEIKEAAQRDLDEETRAETLRTVSSVQRNAWAYDAVSRQLDAARGAASALTSSK